MKKFLAVGALLFLALASCKKEHTCECVSSVSGPNGTTSSTSTTTIKDTKKNAETECNNGDATSSAGGYTSTVSCTLK